MLLLSTLCIQIGEDVLKTKGVVLRRCLLVTSYHSRVTATHGSMSRDLGGLRRCACE